MAGRIVVTPLELAQLGRRFAAAADDVERRIWLVRSATATVRLNDRDPALSVVALRGELAAVGHHLVGASREYGDDAGLMSDTAAAALAADEAGRRLAVAAHVDELSDQIRTWRPGMSLLAVEHLGEQRHQLITELGGNSPSATMVLAAHAASGGSLRNVFEAATAGPGAMPVEVRRLADDGRWEEARELDATLAVARLLVSSPGSSPIALFDDYVGNGTAVDVAANTILAGRDLPTPQELRALLDDLTIGLGPDRAASRGAVRGSERLGGVTAGQWVWLPFEVRMALLAPPATATEGEAATRIRLLGSLGRAGLDHQRGDRILASELTDLAFDWRTGSDPEVHGRIADVVADRSSNLDQAYFNLLGVDGVVRLTNTVATIEAGAEERVEVLGRYGAAMAAVEQRDQLGFTATELFTQAQAARHSPALLLAGTTAFSDEFALASALAVLRDSVPLAGFAGTIADPRALVLHQVNLNGAATSARLVAALGDDSLDLLLWSDQPIDAAPGQSRHPVNDMFDGLLASGRLPGLAAEIVATAGTARRGRVAEYAGQVVEAAMMSDITLLAPVSTGSVSGSSPTSSDEQLLSVINAIETVFLSGAGGGLIEYSETVTELLAVTGRIGGYEAISDDLLEANGEILAVVKLVLEEVQLSEAARQDLINGRIAFWGSAAVSAYSGGFIKGDQAFVFLANVANNALVGEGANRILATDNQQRRLNNIRLHQDDWGAAQGQRIFVAMTRTGGLEPRHLSLSSRELGDHPVRLADGSVDGRPYRDWVSRLNDLEAEASGKGQLYRGAIERRDG